ncbi:hypothetical protein NEMIN01_0182 [Nematocida minor]|uniref:uncharacterized protein n=1 Tax=Nematocida minor TaxID=1912983 RepID=UPI00221EB3E8|nr:uncharacterized protein NEMIN01_0078 [Nematocida minor]XP_051332084.1 uncharacterized protein NEMIN01_0182 [Nematocida minor]KAI5188814.1 hypothetical protein NEMIN01_0078 [Nematocida minor]KAI5188918.1 hypothetical protein NEMIN01_0182 [Nematocida minor]
MYTEDTRIFSTKRTLVLIILSSAFAGLIGYAFYKFAIKPPNEKSRNQAQPSKLQPVLEKHPEKPSQRILASKKKEGEELTRSTNEEQNKKEKEIELQKLFGINEQNGYLKNENGTGEKESFAELNGDTKDDLNFAITIEIPLEYYTHLINA